MNTIYLRNISAHNNEIKYEYKVSEGITQFFSLKNEFVLSYHVESKPMSIELVPDSVLAVPFVANVLPIIWLTDSELIVDELDEAFYNCIPDLKKGYETMFPESHFGGKVTAKRIIKSDRPATPGKCAMFYSGGLDSVHTFISHFEERPDLISVWGSDIKYDNADGWALVHKNITETAQKYDLPDVVIHSTFREFDDEGELTKRFSEQLKDGWWHGVKHGIALLGHVAPYAYLNNISTMYIASSNCPQDGTVRCASNPLTDNNVRFAGCQVMHDGFDFSRQNKAHNIVDFCNRRKETFPLHVCWQSQKGSNCCRCEKCFRTMVELIAENADPKEYGFVDVNQTINESQNIVYNFLSNCPRNVLVLWEGTKKYAESRKKELQRNPYWKDIKWVLKTDFLHPETLKLPLIYRLKRAKGFRGKMSQFAFYKFLHNVKERII